MDACKVQLNLLEPQSGRMTSIEHTLGYPLLIY